MVDFNIPVPRVSATNGSIAEDPPFAKTSGVRTTSISDAPFGKVSDVRKGSLSNADQQKNGWWFWFEPGMSKAEKWLVFKLDLFILWYSCLTFFVKYLDQTSITNAYVTGMSDALNLNGDELNWLTTYYNIGIIIGAPFATFGLTMIHPRYWLPGCTMIMGLFVLFMYKAENIETLYGLRFCAGLFASPVMPGSYYIIGSWYRTSEISKRAGIFTISSYGGAMVSSYIQAGLASSANAREGHAAWQWLFIINFIITVPVAIFGLVGCPNEPRSAKLWWMSEKERQMCIERLAKDHRDSCDPFSWAAFRKIFLSWQLYIFPLAYGFKEFTCGTEMTRWFILYLTKNEYNAVQRNAIPTTVGCTEILTIFIACALVDKIRQPQWVLLAGGLVAIYGYAVFVVFPRNNAWIMSNYIITAAGYSIFGPIISGWANSSCGGDKYLRAITSALLTTLGYTFETIGQQIFYPVSGAPTFKSSRGYVWGLCWTIVATIFSVIVIPLVMRIVHQRQVRAETDDEASKAGSD